jgi:hypothetical protein
MLKLVNTSDFINKLIKELYQKYLTHLTLVNPTYLQHLGNIKVLDITCQDIFAHIKAIIKAP